MIPLSSSCTVHELRNFLCHSIFPNMYSVYTGVERKSPTIPKHKYRSHNGSLPHKMYRNPAHRYLNATLHQHWAQKLMSSQP
jgi:hypothetical protein